MARRDETGWLSVRGGGGEEAVVVVVEGGELLGGCGEVHDRCSGESVVGCEKSADMM